MTVVEEHVSIHEEPCYIANVQIGLALRKEPRLLQVSVLVKAESVVLEDEQRHVCEEHERGDQQHAQEARFNGRMCIY